jgi:hypothetical protein
MKKFFLITSVFTLIVIFIYAQGCIAVRNISGSGQYNLTDNAFTTSTWQLNINNRYFTTYHDFKGSVDQHTPPQNQNIIKSFSRDIGITRLFSKGWSLDLSVFRFPHIPEPAIWNMEA